MGSQIGLKFKSIFGIVEICCFLSKELDLKFSVVQ